MRTAGIALIIDSRLSLEEMRGSPIGVTGTDCELDSSPGGLSLAVFVSRLRSRVGFGGMIKICVGMRTC